MASTQQNISFCTTADGIRIAVSNIGSGYPIVRAAHWLSHVEYDPISPVWSPWIKELSRTNQYISYDQRGCGLSDRSVNQFDLNTLVTDLEAVVDTLGLAQFSLLGMSQGGAIAIEYALRHPERVSDLVLLGAYSRGLLCRSSTNETATEAETLLNLIRLGWGKDNVSFRNVFTSQYIPGGTPQQIQWWNELQQKAAAPETAANILDAFHNLDVTESAKKLCIPTTVMHALGDARIPFEEGRTLASLIPNAKLVSLQSNNHVLLEGEPEWEEFIILLRATLNASAPVNANPKIDELKTLTPSEYKVLEKLACGLSNRDIASTLGKREKTVRNQISSIYSKINMSTRSEMIVFARNLGLGHINN